MRIRYHILGAGAVLLIFFASCRKEFLSKTPNKALLVPATLTELQALLDNNQVMNISPGLGVVSADDLSTTDAGYTSLASAAERNGYIWAPKEDLYEGRTVNDWAVPYQQIFHANVVLDRLAEMSAGSGEQNFYDQVKGTALFSRAFAYYQLAQLFAAPYVVETAAILPGVPLRLTADVNINPGRGTVGEVYRQILADLQEAWPLLPVRQDYKTRPVRAAALALLARVNLLMKAYGPARQYATMSLELNAALIDYNTLNTASTRPFPVALPNNNPEILYYASMVTYGFFTGSQTGMNLALYGSYAANDLRKGLFFRDRGNNIYNFKGNYTGNTTLFSGLATDEVYLVKAECEVRMGDVNAALQTLNTLLITRRRKGTYQPYAALSREEALDVILQERRKELVARDSRWTDLRRLNMDERYRVTLNRIVAGVSYTLLPNDERYTLPIPLQEVQLSGIGQNKR